jgi:hypothetical protein
MRPRHHTPLAGAVAGAMAGVGAGLLASLAMDRFQALAARAGASPGGGGDPATVKAAEKALGRRIPKARKAEAGTAVHYGFGTLLGLAYGAASAVEPRMAAGFGLPYGGAVALLADEALVPAAGLGGKPWESPLSTHAYSLASHLVFGAALEAGRRALLRIL